MHSRLDAIHAIQKVSIPFRGSGDACSDAPSAVKVRIRRQEMETRVQEERTKVRM